MKVLFLGSVVLVEVLLGLMRGLQIRIAVQKGEVLVRSAFVVSQLEIFFVLNLSLIGVRISRKILIKNEVFSWICRKGILAALLTVVVLVRERVQRNLFLGVLHVNK